MRGPSSREERLWGGAAFLVVAYMALAASGQRLLDSMRARDLLLPAIAGLVAMAGAVVLVWAIRQRLNPRQWIAVAVCASLFLRIISSLEIVQERLHLVQYAVLAGVLEAALRERWTVASGAAARAWWRPAVAAACATALVGWADEGVQALTPERVYDLRDVGLNALAGVLFLAGRGAVRRLADTTSGREATGPGPHRE
jgi:hypothetical protein